MNAWGEHVVRDERDASMEFEMKDGEEILRTDDDDDY